MLNPKVIDRWPVLAGAALVLAAPAVAFTLASQGIGPAWLPGAVASVMTVVAIALIAGSRSSAQ